MADTIVIETSVATVLEVSGLQGPQGATGATGSTGAAGQGVPTGGTTGQVLRKASGTNYDTEWAAAASGSGSVTSVALAGTGLSVSGSPVTTSGTLTANVSYGTTAGTACEGNDARIATIGSGTINTLDVGLEQAGSINTGAYSEDTGLALAGGAIDTSYGGGDIVTAAGGGTINTQGTGSIELGVSGTRTTLTGTATAPRAISLPNASGTIATTSQAADYEVTDSTKGIILKSPNNTRWRVTINDDGTLSRAALALMTLFAFASSGFAQVRDMVTDTNGNIVTGRTNELTFTNNLRFQTLTNANSRTAIIGTNGALTAGNPPSAAAANGALLTADGAGGSSFVASKVAFATKPTNTSRNNWTNNTWPDSSQNQDPHLSVTLTAGKAHEVSWALTWADTGNVNYLVFGLPTTSGRRAGGIAINVGGSLVGIQQNATNQSYITPSTIIAGANLTWVYWGKLYVPAGTSNTTVFIAWWPTNNTTNVSTLLSNSYLRAVQLD